MALPNSKDLRSYLLGTLVGENELIRDQIDERLLLDGEFFELLEAEEEELIQNYADGDLSPEESDQFESHFLISNERVKKVEFAKRLRLKVDTLLETAEPESVSRREIEKPKRGFFSGWILSPLPAMASLLLVVGVGSFLVWNFYLKPSENDAALASLNKAFSKERPLESRISGFDYAPKKDTRSGRKVEVDSISLGRARNEIIETADSDRSAKNLGVLGRLYLSVGETEKALLELERAARLAPNDAQILNDLGVAYLEKAKSFGNEDGKRLEFEAKALDRFDAALKVNPAFPEALFNRALSLEKVMTQEAIKAWQQYLDVDSTSPWAKEAKNRQAALESEKVSEITSEALEANFLAAVKAGTIERAYQTVSENREMIKLKYLPQKLAMSFTSAGTTERKKYLEALTALGDIENRNNRDRFASDLAAYYGNLLETEIQKNRAAHNLIKKGFAECLKNDFQHALESFEDAQRIYLSAGNELEAKSYNNHLIGYVLFNLLRDNEAITAFEETADYTSKKKYRWLESDNEYWLDGVKQAVNGDPTMEYRRSCENGLQNAKDLNDPLLTQRYLLSLINHHHQVGDDVRTLRYIQQILDVSTKSSLSIRQKARNLNIFSRVFEDISFPGYAKAFAMESLNFSKEIDDGFFDANFKINAAKIFTKSAEYDTAEDLLVSAKTLAESGGASKIKDNLVTAVDLHMGHLELARGENGKAIASFQDCLSRLDPSDPIRSYEVEKSLIAAYQSAGNDVEVSNRLPSVLNRAEKYRTEILEEQQRNNFFDNEQSIYDIAVEHNLRLDQVVEAYDYAESSGSRSLLDWLTGSVRSEGNGTDIDFVFSGSSQPMKLTEIQSRMPSGSQILQFTVLPEKTVGWVIGKNSLNHVSIDVRSSQLENSIRNYLDVLESGGVEDVDETLRLSKELYKLLITPVKRFLDPRLELVVIPSKVLNSVPFAALSSPAGSFLLSEFVLVHAPSANVFVLSSEQAKKKSDKKNELFLGVGNPSFDRERFPELQDLPDAISEVRNIAQDYESANVLLGKQATVSEFSKLKNQADVIHFAGHYIVSQQAPLYSGLLFAADNQFDDGGLLTNRELLKGEELNARMIVLSACDSGVEGFRISEGMIGLSRSFLATGVPVVVGSRWEVDSKATAELMKKFHSYRRKEALSTAVALRKAQLDLAGSAKYNLPFYWAAFGVFGGAASY